jgi:hypothetical protein
MVSLNGCARRAAAVVGPAVTAVAAAAAVTHGAAVTTMATLAGAPVDPVHSECARAGLVPAGLGPLGPLGPQGPLGPHGRLGPQGALGSQGALRPLDPSHPWGLRPFWVHF